MEGGGGGPFVVCTYFTETIGMYCHLARSLGVLEYQVGYAGTSGSDIPYPLASGSYS